LPVDLATNARGLGAHVIECRTYTDFAAALEQASAIAHTTVIYVRNDRYAGVGGYESWWDVPPAEVSQMPGVRKARKAWATKRKLERHFL
jgi:3D-(3,5/4)-trihydroxycyclohexane-1,2-dione acylhydrolase (decyclizing)